MSQKLRQAKQLLDAAKNASADEACVRIIQAVEIILDEFVKKERKESNARMSPRAVRRITRHS
jgi:hypothetical protein